MVCGIVVKLLEWEQVTIQTQVVRLKRVFTISITLSNAQVARSCTVDVIIMTTPPLFYYFYFQHPALKGKIPDSFFPPVITYFFNNLEAR